MQKLTLFIDENGDNKLSNDASKFFIVVGIIVKNEDLDNIKNQFDIIVRNKAGGRLKSRNIAGEHNRRKTLLSELQDISFKYHAVIVDKSKIAVKNDSGLNYKQSFYKFFYDKVYSKFTFTMDTIDIFQHNIGSPDFMNGFNSYLDKKYSDGEDLFTGKPKHQFVSDTEQTLIQLSDFVAGTLLYLYDSSKNMPDDIKKEIQLMLYQKDIGSLVWPMKSSVVANVSDNKKDNAIAEYNKNNIQAFIDTYSGSTDSFIKMQLAVLEFLACRQIALEDDTKYTAENLINYLSQTGFGIINLEDFRTNIIAKLRDEKILIAGDRTGYRLILSEDHLSLYINHGSKIVLPMLKRLKDARNSIQIGIDIDWDILKNYPELKSIIDILARQ